MAGMGAFMYATTRLLLVAGSMRRLVEASQDYDVPVMVVGGNFTLGGRSSNLAQYDPELKLWVDQFEPHLFVYDAVPTVGLVSTLATNKTDAGFDDLFIAGAFDTTCASCQATYCSVGRWAGHGLDKVGEGLCSSRMDPTTRINSLVLGSSGDLFVGGSFEARVWNGTDFSLAKHVARFVPSNPTGSTSQGGQGGQGG
eukprot:CAMPEP_0172601224 /NCGR_PEP_ID=MMETSP1068-20121228/21387_1 /TAXON_ID=35684 /ORGANISM="Pseudopedinella elastica, Strain CCMP716" /LENGTH=197 /DNA_ID=CAMNT_0013402135 /DNA_START=155 /DNA_END=745 /DNA_ORIENTATION=-